MSHLILADISKALTVEVVNKAFKAKTGSADSVEKISVMRAAPVGEGLLGAVYRIKVIGRQHKTSFVAKGLVADELLRTTLNCTQYFEREIQFYSKILPALKAIESSSGAKESIQSKIPICYDWVCDGYNDYLLLEDLAERGYVGVSKNLKIYERNAALQTLAHFHAVSLALRNKEPELFMKIANQLRENYYYEQNKSWYDAYLQNAIQLDLIALAEYEDPETSVYYKKFIDLLNKDAYSQLIDLVSERGNYPVLCHGDAWCSNFLYFDKKSVVIDFQLVRCASLVTDLAYLIIVSNLCRNKEHFNDAVEVYYIALQQYLEDMKLNVSIIYPRTVLDVELKKFGKYGLLASLSSIPLMASERYDMIYSSCSEYQGYDRIPLNELWRLTPFKEEEDKKQLVNAVRVAVDAGLI